MLLAGATDATQPTLGEPLGEPPRKQACNHRALLGFSATPQFRALSGVEIPIGCPPGKCISTSPRNSAGGRVFDPFYLAGVHGALPWTGGHIAERFRLALRSTVSSNRAGTEFARPIGGSCGLRFRHEIVVPMRSAR